MPWNGRGDGDDGREWALVNLRKVSFYASGVIIVAGLLILLIWPELAGPLTMGFIILAVGLGAYGVSGKKERK